MSIARSVADVLRDHDSTPSLFLNSRKYFCVTSSLRCPPVSEPFISLRMSPLSSWILRKPLRTLAQN
jgi:hypothetical protein